MTLLPKSLKSWKACYTLFMDIYICSKSVKTCLGRINTNCRVIVTFAGGRRMKERRNRIVWNLWEVSVVFFVKLWSKFNYKMLRFKKAGWWVQRYLFVPFVISLNKPKARWKRLVENVFQVPKQLSDYPFCHPTCPTSTLSFISTIRDPLSIDSSPAEGSRVGTGLIIALRGSQLWLKAFFSATIHSRNTHSQAYKPQTQLEDSSLEKRPPSDICGPPVKSGTSLAHLTSEVH